MNILLIVASTKSLLLIRISSELENQSTNPIYVLDYTHQNPIREKSGKIEIREKTEQSASAILNQSTRQAVPLAVKEGSGGCEYGCRDERQIWLRVTRTYGTARTFDRER